MNPVSILAINSFLFLTLNGTPHLLTLSSLHHQPYSESLPSSNSSSNPTSVLLYHFSRILMTVSSARPTHNSSMVMSTWVTLAGLSSPPLQTGQPCGMNKVFGWGQQMPSEGFQESDLSPVLNSQVLHDTDYSITPASRGLPQRPSRHRKDRDRQGPGQVPWHICHRGQLFRGPGLQVHGPNVLRLGPGQHPAILPRRPLPYL